MFPHTLFPVGLWRCTIHDFSFLSFRSLLSFHTLDSWRCTDTTWPFIAYISFYSRYSGWTINLVMHLSGLTNGAKWPLISFFSSCSHHPSRYLDIRLFLSSRKYWSCWHNSENHTEETFWISLKRRILLCRDIWRIFWPSFIKIRKIYIHY